MDLLRGCRSERAPPLLGKEGARCQFLYQFHFWNWKGNYKIRIETKRDIIKARIQISACLAAVAPVVIYKYLATVSF